MHSKVEHICLECNTLFHARRDAKYCSTQCRSRGSKRSRGMLKEPLPNGYRKCGKCQELKHEIDFYWLSGKRERYQSYCKPCQRHTQVVANRRRRGLPDNAPAYRKPAAPEGTIRSDQKGYLLEKCSGHHRADKHGWVFQHILVAEKMHNFPISREFTIHHKNRDKADNHPANLELRLGPHGKGGSVLDTLLASEENRSLAITILQRYGIRCELASVV